MNAAIPRDATRRDAYLYARVSTDAQADKGWSLPTQLEGMRRLADERGYHIVDTFTDAYSGTEYDRPGINALLDALIGRGPAAPAPIVLAYDVDRLLGRDDLAQALIRRDLKLARAQTYYVLGGDSESGDGELQVDFKALFARFDNRKRREASLRGKRGTVAAGNVMLPGGCAPYGYTYHRDGRRGWLEIDLVEAAVILELIYRALAEGASTYAIARSLSAAGYATRADTVSNVPKQAGYGQWDATTVQHIVRNPVYKGDWYYGKTRRTKGPDGRRKTEHVARSEWQHVTVPAIVSPDLWARANAQLALNKREAPRNRRHEYLLAGHLFCPCGRRLAGSKHAQRPTGCYQCTKKYSAPWLGVCTHGARVRQDTIEATVWGWLERKLFTAAGRAELLAELHQTADASVERVERALAAARADLAAVDAGLERLLDEALRAHFPADMLATRAAQYGARRTHLAEELARLELAVAAQRSTVAGEEHIIAYLDAVGAGVPAMTFAERRQLLAGLHLRVTVGDPAAVQQLGTPDALTIELLVDGGLRDIVPMACRCAPHNLTSSRLATALPISVALALSRAA